MKTKFKIGTAVRNYLIANQDITAFTGKNIFPLMAPKNTKGDIIIYQRDKYSKTRSKMGIAEEIAEVFITVVSDDYDRSVTLAEEINETLERKNFQLLDSTETFEDGKYLQILLFQIK